MIGLLVLVGIGCLIAYVVHVNGQGQNKGTGGHSSTSSPVYGGSPSSSYQARPAPVIASPKRPERKFTPQNIFVENYVSYSRLNTYKNCPKRFELVYLYGLDEEPSRPAYVGSLVHKMLERFMLSEEDGGWTIESPEVVRKILAFKASAEEADGRKFIVDEAELRASIDSFFGLNCGLEKSAVESVEHTIETRVAGYPVKCVIDRIDRGAKERLVDYKTGKRSSVARAQLNFYGLCYTVDAFRPLDLQYQFLKTQEESTWSFGRAQSETARSWMESSVAEIEATGNFRKITYLCNWCGVRQQCALL